MKDCWRVCRSCRAASARSRVPASWFDMVSCFKCGREKRQSAVRHPMSLHHGKSARLPENRGNDVSEYTVKQNLHKEGTREPLSGACGATREIGRAHV